MPKYFPELIPRDTYYSHYKLLLEYNLQDSHFLGNKNQRHCLFCDNTFISNKDKFKKVSHAISKAFKSNIKITMSVMNVMNFSVRVRMNF